MPKPPKEPRICLEPTCKQEFVPSPRGRDQRFCSKKCWTKTNYWNKIANRTPTGYHHGNSALSADQIGEVVVALYGTEEPVRAMAKRYEVDESVIHRIAQITRPRKLPRAPKEPTKRCRHCGKAFPWRRSQRYCSVACRKQANQARRRARRRAELPPKSPLLEQWELDRARERRANNETLVRVAADLHISVRTLRRYLQGERSPRRDRRTMPRRDAQGKRLRRPVRKSSPAVGSSE